MSLAQIPSIEFCLYDPCTSCTFIPNVSTLYITLNHSTSLTILSHVAIVSSLRPHYHLKFHESLSQGRVSQPGISTHDIEPFSSPPTPLSSASPFSCPIAVSPVNSFGDIGGTPALTGLCRPGGSHPGGIGNHMLGGSSGSMVSRYLSEEGVVVPFVVPMTGGLVGA